MSFLLPCQDRCIHFPQCSETTCNLDADVDVLMLVAFEVDLYQFYRPKSEKIIIGWVIDRCVIHIMHLVALWEV